MNTAHTWVCVSLFVADPLSFVQHVRLTVTQTPLTRRRKRPTHQVVLSFQDLMDVSSFSLSQWHFSASRNRFLLVCNYGTPPSTGDTSVLKGQTQASCEAKPHRQQSSPPPPPVSIRLLRNGFQEKVEMFFPEEKWSSVTSPKALTHLKWNTKEQHVSALIASQHVPLVGVQVDTRRLPRQQRGQISAAAKVRC